jgi:hypothetical protein
MLDPGRDGKLGSHLPAMRHEPIPADPSLPSDAATGEPVRYRRGDLFDRMTLYMAMMFLGHTLLILALVKL